MKQNHSIIDPFEEVTEGYFAEIRRYCFRRDKNASSGLKFTYTPMHGVGAEAVKRAFEEFNLPAYVPVREQVSGSR